MPWSNSSLRWYSWKATLAVVVIFAWCMYTEGVNEKIKDVLQNKKHHTPDWSEGHSMRYT